jgi:hypothetical protein
MVFPPTHFHVFDECLEVHPTVIAALAMRGRHFPSKLVIVPTVYFQYRMHRSIQPRAA